MPNSARLFKFCAAGTDKRLDLLVYPQAFDNRQINHSQDLQQCSATCVLRKNDKHTFKIEIQLCFSEVATEKLKKFIIQ